MAGSEALKRVLALGKHILPHHCTFIDMLCVIYLGASEKGEIVFFI